MDPDGGGNKLANADWAAEVKAPQAKMPTRLFKGMKIEFFGTVYKVIAVRSNGKVTMKQIKKGGP